MRFLLLFTLFIVSLNSLAQTTSQIFNEIKRYHKENDAMGRGKPLFLNQAENTLEHEGTNIPLFEVDILYKIVNGHHLVTFNCDSECITGVDSNGNDEQYTGIAFEFNTKSQCYEWINLFSKPRDSLE